MAERGAPQAESPCPCTRPEQFELVFSEFLKVLKALHIDNGILTSKECSDSASKGLDWYKIIAIVVASKSPEVVQKALDVVREQSGVEDYFLNELAGLLQVLSTLYQEKMVTEQEVEGLKQAEIPWERLVHIQCTKPPDVVTRTANVLAEMGLDEEGRQLKVLSTLYQKKMVTEQEVEDLKPAKFPVCHLLAIQCTKPLDVVKRTAEVLAELGHDEREKLQLIVLSTLYQEKMLTEQDVNELKRAEIPWDCLVRVQCTKPSDVVKRTAKLLVEMGLDEESWQLKVLSTLYQEKMLTEQDVDELKRAAVPWERLVRVQCTKQPDVVMRTAELLAEMGLDEEGWQLKVLSTLHQEKMITRHEVEDLKPDMWLWRQLVQIQCTKPPDVAKGTAELLAEVGFDEEGTRLIVLSTLYQKKMVTEQEVEELKQAEVLWHHLPHIQCSKPFDVVKRTAELLAEVGHDEEGKQLNVLNELFNVRHILTTQECSEVAERGYQQWRDHLVLILAIKPVEAVKEAIEVMKLYCLDTQRLHVLSELYQKKLLTIEDVSVMKEEEYPPDQVVLVLCAKPSEVVAEIADGMNALKYTEEATILSVLSVLNQKKVITHHEMVEISHVAHLSSWLMVEREEKHVMKDHTVKEVLWQGLVNVQCSKPPEVVTTTAEVLNELGLTEEATQLRVMSELYQKELISEYDIHEFPHCHYMTGYSSRHWLDSLVDIQSSKPADVHARTFDMLKKYSLTKEMQSKHTDVTEYQPLRPSSSTMATLEEWESLSEYLLSKESHFTSSLKEIDIFPFKTKVSSLQAGGGSDPPEREDASNLLTDEAALKRLCWIPFGIKTVSIEAKGGILFLEPQSDDLQEMKEDTIFVEVPPGAVSTSADVKMRYAIIPSGSFTLPEGYQFGSPVVYIYYDGQRVTKPLTLHLPHCYGGKDHARDGLSFAVAPHSLKGRSVYQFQLLGGGKFPVNSRYGVIEIGGHCSLFTIAFENGATVNCQAFSLIKENEEETECKAECSIAVTNAAYCWRSILLQNRPGWEVSLPNAFQFKSDRITATLKEKSHVHGDWRAYFTGTSELLSSHVRYDVFGIHSTKSLKDAVKAYAYPPAIKYIVKYKKELRRTGTSTEVTLQLHISDTDQPMDFPYTAYERIQVASPTTILSPALTEITSQPSLSLCKAAPLSPPPMSPAQTTHTWAAHTLSVCPPLSEASSSVSPTPLTSTQSTQTETLSDSLVCPLHIRPTPAEFLDHFRQQFIVEVDASTIVLELEHRGIISNGDQKTISRNEDNTQQSQFLHSCLKKKCDAKALTDVCDIIATVKGNPRMKSFGEHMKMEWEKDVD